MTRCEELGRVFRIACRLVRQESNDFSWSGWEDANDALAELEPLATSLHSEFPRATRALDLYFLPTGPLQELSLSSGWGQEFLALAERYDAAWSLKEPDACPCENDGLRSREMARDVGTDKTHGEAEVKWCLLCSRFWLRYLIEEEAFSNSGRWYLGEVSPYQASRITADQVRSEFEIMSRYFYGGSYYEGRSGLTSGPIR